MTNVREVDMKEIISLTKKKYSVSKEGIKNDECGWSYLCTFWESASVQGGWLHAPGGHGRLQGIQARALAWCWPPGGRGWRRVARRTPEVAGATPRLFRVVHWHQAK
jgi:hypothetical protein